MDGRGFVDLVKRMRDAQRAYFRTRSKQSLQDSKALERQVDEEIEWLTVGTGEDWEPGDNE